MTTKVRTIRLTDTDWNNLKSVCQKLELKPYKNSTNNNSIRALLEGISQGHLIVSKKNT